MSLIAMLALAVLGPVPALAAAPHAAPAPATPEKPRNVPEPRAQLPGEVPGFRLPFPAGAEVRVDQGWNTGFSHNGKAAYAYDFGLPVGTDVLAAAAGVVSYVHDGETACGGPDLLMNANLVTIDHPDGSATQYGHLSTIDVEVGQIVSAGQVIAKSGNTGYSQCIAHLHFARQYQGGVVTDSIPVYFEGYPDAAFHTGDLVTGPPAARCEASVGAFCATYAADALDVPQSFTRKEAFLNFDWRSKGPGGYWLDGADLGFSASWSGRFAFPSAGRYAIGVISSGAVRVSIDGVPVVERWLDPGRPFGLTVSKSLGGGIHRIDVDYMTTSGHGLLKVGWGRLFADE